MTSASHDNDHWEDALDGIGLTDAGQAARPTLSLLFANALYPDFEALAAEAYKRSGASVLVGCTGRGVIGAGTEIEGRPALAILNLDLPGAQLFPKHIESQDFEGLTSPADWQRWLGVFPDQVNAWLTLTDPFTFDAEPLIRGLSTAYPGKPVAGGLASGLAYGAWTWLMLNDQPYSSGAILLGIGGDTTLRSVVAQGAVPIGAPGIVTAAEGRRIQTIDGRPAAEMRSEAIAQLDENLRWQAQESLLIGLPTNGERNSGQPGLVIRDVLSTDRRSGVLEIRGAAGVGQSIQFHLADPEEAGKQLHAQLRRAKGDLAGSTIVGALLCSTTTRGIELFHVPDHDVDAVKGTFGDIPMAGFFSSGEIATQNSRTLLHGSTATLTFFVKK